MAGAGIRCQHLPTLDIGQYWKHMGVLMTGCGEETVQVGEVEERVGNNCFMLALAEVFPTVSAAAVLTGCSN